MVYGTYTELVSGVYKPTKITFGGLTLYVHTELNEISWHSTEFHGISWYKASDFDWEGL